MNSRPPAPAWGSAVKNAAPIHSASHGFRLVLAHNPGLGRRGRLIPGLAAREQDGGGEDAQQGSARVAGQHRRHPAGPLADQPDQERPGG